MGRPSKATTQIAFRLPPESFEKLDSLARWMLDSRTSVVIRAVNELYAREASRRGLNPFPETEAVAIPPPTTTTDPYPIPPANGNGQRQKETAGHL